MDGTWQASLSDNGYERYLFVSDSLALMLSFKCTPDSSVYRFGGDGMGGDVRLVSDSLVNIFRADAVISWAADRQSFTLTSEGRWSAEHLHRVVTPAYISRILRSTLIKNP